MLMRPPPAANISSGRDVPEVDSVTGPVPMYRRVPPRNEIFSPAAPRWESAVSNATRAVPFRYNPPLKVFALVLLIRYRVFRDSSEFELTTSPLLPVMRLE